MAVKHLSHPRYTREELLDALLDDLKGIHVNMMVDGKMHQVREKEGRIHIRYTGSTKYKYEFDSLDELRSLLITAGLK
jgi:hypothetical protein